MKQKLRIMMLMLSLMICWKSTPVLAEEGDLNEETILPVSDDGARAYANTWKDDTTAVVANSDGSYTECASLKEAIDRTPNQTETKILIVKDIWLNQKIDVKNKKITLVSEGAHTLTFTGGDPAFAVYDQSVLILGEQGNDTDVLTITSDIQVSQVFSLYSSAKLILNSGTITTSQNPKESIVKLWEASMEINGGTILGNSTNVQGIRVLGKSSVVMNGGSIENCRGIEDGSSNGGGVVLNNSTFTMNGGTIKNCSAKWGGGVFVPSGTTFTMTGGTIENCSALEDGGGFMAQGDLNGGKVIMTGGEIVNCTVKKANGGGGGLYIQNTAEFIMSGGVIRSCTAGGEDATGNGGGVLVSGTAVFKMSENAKIEGCKAANGGGLYVSNSASFAMSDTAEITGCQSTNGGGVRMGGTTKFAMKDTAKITKCSAEYGGGVCLLENAELTMENGEISGCTGNQQGGGVRLDGSAVFTMKNGNISNNQTILTKYSDNYKGCKYDGGGVHASGNTVFTMENGTITGNQATRRGGGIQLRDGAKFTMENGTVSNNICQGQGAGISIGFGKANADSPTVTATIKAGTITGNKVEDDYGYGGGIYVDKDHTLNIANVLITENNATALGGGIWSCRTGDIKIYVKDGGAVYDNAAVSGDEKTANQAGDDIASTVTSPAKGFLQLSAHMVGGGANRYYEDGGIMELKGHPYYGEGLGAPDGSTPRYDGERAELITESRITSSIALKNVVSEESKTAAKDAVAAAESGGLTITGNGASRGGGIATNGDLIIGTPTEEDTGNLTVKKEVSGSEGDVEDEFEIQITLTDSAGNPISGEYGEMTFKDGVAVVTLKDGRSAAATGLPAGARYAVEETKESADGYHVTYTNQKGEIAKDTTLSVVVKNEKEPEEPEEPDKPDVPKTQETLQGAPKTGDESSLSLWLMTMCFASLIIVSVPALHRLRHRNKNHK